MKPTGKALQVRKTTLPVVRPSIALALGGGGARGLAHILMLEVFDELGLKPTVIAGTSIGAIVRRRLCLGPLGPADPGAHRGDAEPALRASCASCCRRASEPMLKILNILPIRAALLKPEALLDYLLPSKVARDFADLQIPLKVVATDYYAQEQVVISEGPLRAALAASIALPALFTPVTIDGRLLMDGGLVNPLPFDVLDGEADITVAIDVSGASLGPGKHPQPSAFAALMSSSQILQRSIVREKLKARQPDIYIDVEVDEFYVLDFHRFKKVLAAAAPAKEHLSASSPAFSRATPQRRCRPPRPRPPPRSPPRKRRLPGLKRLSRADARPRSEPRRNRARASAWRSAAARRAGLLMC